ncbi:amidase [Thermomonospora umbrina]|uniref:Amidase n=1 Tax=Thermomonospora umbrina TaxID=111806 RepID=A0A3D9T102_9ACTN|nr:amidase family protein [Thermomonospora umbrina]REF00014.1 amidase [Thermomonospora umbrina]
MDHADYREHDAVGLAALVASGDVSPAELLECAIDRTEQVNPRLNAVILPMYDLARKRAGEQLSGPFAGVPFLIKDLAQEYAGLPTGAGNRALSTVPAPEHAEIVRRWLDSGLVIFGKTNTPEFGAKGITEPEVNGPTRNPWDLSRTPGGSSGGSAAAVAAGIVPVAGANDGGGSIRIPAACCGLVGLKPGRGLTPFGPYAAESLHGAAAQGVVSRTVRDTAAMLDVITSAADPYGPYLAASPPAGGYAEPARREPGPLRIGFTTASPLGTPVDPQAIAAVERTAALLEDLGHTVEPATTGIDESGLATDFLIMWAATMASTIDQIRAETGAPNSAFELDTRLLAAAGRARSASDYVTVHQRWNVYGRRLAAFHETYDLLLTPTLARPPVEVGELDTPPALRTLGRLALALRLAGPLSKTRQWHDTVIANLSPVPFTQLANITGRPAISLPTYQTPDGLPLGVQFVAPLGGELVLLQLATQLESASPWARPSI